MDFIGFLICVACAIYIWKNIGSDNQDKLRATSETVKKRVKRALDD